jgi:hypothetical protein
MTHQTKSIITSKEDFVAFRVLWKTLHAQKAITSSLMAARCLLLGSSLDLAFTPAVRTSKITHNYNGNPYAARDRALTEIRFGKGIRQLPEDLRKLVYAALAQKEAAL